MIMNESCPQRSGYPQYLGVLGLNQQPINDALLAWEPFHKLHSNQAREGATLVKAAELQGHSR